MPIRKSLENLHTFISVAAESPASASTNEMDLGATGDLGPKEIGGTVAVENCPWVVNNLPYN